jgi:hypothetical protein
MPSLRVYRASDDLARDLVARVGRWLLLGVGGVLMLIGIAAELVPFGTHILGMPILVIGLMIVLRNSIKARRRFVEIQHAHPRIVFPIRRLMRREPEIVQVFWQQTLRVERLILPRRLRFFIRTRRRFKLRARVA